MPKERKAYKPLPEPFDLEGPEFQGAGSGSSKRTKTRAKLPEITTEDFAEIGTGPPPRNNRSHNEDDYHDYIDTYEPVRYEPRRTQGASGRQRYNLPQNRRKTPARKAPRPAVRPGVKRAAVVGIALIATFIVVVRVVLSLITYNAFAVYLDGRHMGYIHFNPDSSAEAFQNEAILHIRGQFSAADIIVNERVELRPTRAPMSERINGREMISRLSMPPYGFTIRVGVVDIYVNGVRETTLRNMDEVNGVIHELQRAYLTDLHTTASFVEPFELVIRYVDRDYVDISVFTPRQALARLDRPVAAVIPYTVQPGDIKDRIARNHGTTTNAILGVNYGLTAFCIIRPGDVLMIPTSRPLLTVKTIDYIDGFQPIPFPVEREENPNLAMAVVNVLREGRDGYKNARVRITKINGEVVNTEVLESEIIREPEPHIVEVGTMP